MKQVNKDGVIQNQAELTFRQHSGDSTDSTTELKTQRSLCYAAGQEPGGEHQLPLILQDFTLEYASTDPNLQNTCQTTHARNAQGTRKIPKGLSQSISGRQRNTLD
jgi:hypothetical protein